MMTVLPPTICAKSWGTNFIIFSAKSERRYLLRRGGGGERVWPKIILFPNLTDAELPLSVDVIEGIPPF